MIKFHCTNCGMEFSVPNADAGKKGRCPKCKTILTVPEDTGIELQKDVFEDSGPSSIDRQGFSGRTKLDAPDVQIRIDKLEDADHELTESVPVRKLPAILDIFFYPASRAGLIIIAIIIGIPLIINILSGLAGPFWFFIWIPGLLINIVIFLYSYWYVCECIRDSAEGSIRAPDVLVNSPAIEDMFFQTLRFVLCLLFFAAPAVIYYLYTERTDNYFYILLGLSVFFFPMGLLSVIMYDSLWGLNPFLLIVSFFKTFFQYIGLVLLFYIICIFIIFQIARMEVPAVLTFLTTALDFYFLLVLAHLLGRFYWRYQDRLGWDN